MSWGVRLFKDRPSKPVSRVLGLAESDIQAIVHEVTFKLVHSLPTGMRYDYLAMTNPFELYHSELHQSNRDPKTTARYGQIIISYRSWLKGKQPDIANGKEYLAYLKDKGYSQRSLLLYYHVLRLFFTFFGQPLKLKLKKPKTLARYYDRGDIESLIAQASKGLYHQTQEIKRRNEALILTLVYSGLRRGELLNLQVDDIDFNRRLIVVRQRKDFATKDREDRVIPMVERLTVPLRQQCARKSAEDKVFEGLNGRSVYRIVTGLARAVGLEGFHPHSARHFFGTQLVEKGGNLRHVQQLMGHSSLEVTATYLDVSAQHLRQTVELLDRETTTVGLEQLQNMPNPGSGSPSPGSHANADRSL